MRFHSFELHGILFSFSPSPPPFLQAHFVCYSFSTWELEVLRSLAVGQCDMQNSLFKSNSLLSIELRWNFLFHSQYFSDAYDNFSGFLWTYKIGMWRWMGLPILTDSEIRLNIDREALHRSC